MLVDGRVVIVTSGTIRSVESKNYVPDAVINFARCYKIKCSSSMCTGKQKCKYRLRQNYDHNNHVPLTVSIFVSKAVAGDVPGSVDELTVTVALTWPLSDMAIGE